MIFNTGEKVKLSPTSPSEEAKVYTSKKTNSCAFYCAISPIYSCTRLISQPSGKGQIEEIIEPSPDQELEDL